jgi:hypothetical protein
VGNTDIKVISESLYRSARRQNVITFWKKVEEAGGNEDEGRNNMRVRNPFLVGVAVPLASLKYFTMCWG